MSQSKNRYFTKAETALHLGSVALILLSFFLFDRKNALTLAASLVGVTSLIFAAKGNPAGQALMLAFSVLYGIISFRVAYYGEMITYLGMTAPMALYALIAWLRHPYSGNRREVLVRRLPPAEYALAAGLSLAVTAGFYFVLRFFETANLAWSTVSVTTSFLAVFLTGRRSPFYALAYAANDLVLIVLWSLAAVQTRAYLSVVVCFAAFFVNDLYGFFNWRRMQKRQQNSLTGGILQKD